jgi:outer membrane protein assembly factor BamB
MVSIAIPIANSGKYMNERPSQRNLIGCALLFAMGIVALYQFVPLFLPECYESSTEHRSATLTENFEMYWGDSPIFIANSSKAVYMVANKNHVVFYGTRDARCGNPGVVSLDTENGRVLFSKSYLPSNEGIYHTAYSPVYFFLGYNGTGKAINNSTIGAGGVAAYEIDTGKIRWTQPISGTREVRSLVANNALVSIDGGGFSDWYYLINSETGEIVSRLDKLKLGLPSPPANFAYWYERITTNNLGFTPETNMQNIVFWTGKFAQVFQPPILTNQILLIRKGEGMFPGNVVALDGQTGESLWETKNDVISNVAVSGSTAFFLTSSAELMALTVETGKEVGTIQFSGGEIQQGTDRGYFVAAGGDKMFVYFGDSRQLFAFRFSPNEQNRD